MDKIVFLVSIKDVMFIWFILVFTIFIHEVGHLLGFKLTCRMDYDNWHITVGAGKNLINSKKISVNIVPLIGSLNFLEPLRLSKFQNISALLGGPLFSLLGAIISCRILKITDDVVLRQRINIIYQCFTFQFIYTILPVKYIPLRKEGTSDGLKLLKLLRNDKNSKGK